MTLLSRQPALIDSSLESRNGGARQTHVHGSQNVLHSMTFAGMMTFPACYQHIPKGRPGILVPVRPVSLGSIFWQAETDRLFTSAVENRAVHLPVDKRKKSRASGRRGRLQGFSLQTQPLPRFRGCGSPGILLFIECYRWLRGQEALPLLNSALGIPQAWKEPSSSLPGCFSKPPLSRKKRGKQRVERERNSLKYLKSTPLETCLPVWFLVAF